jgi:hypothetical protein
MKKYWFLFVGILASFSGFYAQSIAEKYTAGAFTILSKQNATPIYVDEQDYAVIQKASVLFQTDIEMLTGQRPSLIKDLNYSNIIIIGSLEKSAIINQLIKEKKINVDQIKGKWEAYQIQVVRQPMKGVENALVITGSDRRGTAFGVFELSQKMGVSPWYWWYGYVSIEAMHFTRALNTNGISWKILADHGRTASAVTPFPVTATTQTITANSPHLEYDVYLYSKDSAKLELYFSPTLNFHNTPEGLQYGISIDQEKLQVISLNKEDNNVRTWERWVANNIIIKTSGHYITKPGKHTIKFWMINSGVVLQKLVLDMGGVKHSNLGPPETMTK